jgi:hypothetical protein
MVQLTDERFNDIVSDQESKYKAIDVALKEMQEAIKKASGKPITRELKDRLQIEVDFIDNKYATTLNPTIVIYQDTPFILFDNIFKQIATEFMMQVSK